MKKKMKNIYFILFKNILILIDMNRFPQRLSTDKYIRPKKTITESVQDQKSIQRYLKDFEEVDESELPYVPISTQLRYISWDKTNKCELFRFGGLLIRVLPQYVLLAGAEGKSFSAQRYTFDEKKKVIHETRFFRKLRKEELVSDELQQTMEASQKIIQQQNEIIENQKRQIRMLKKK